MNGVLNDRNGKWPERQLPGTAGQVKYQYVPAAEWSDHEV